MNIVILGAAGFIGTNLTLALAQDADNRLTLVDVNRQYFQPVEKMQLSNVSIVESALNPGVDFAPLLRGQDVVYHLVSTTVPGTSNRQIPEEIKANVVFTAELLDACVEAGVKRVIFVSSGGTVYGKAGVCPLTEDMPTEPISSYGLQKLTIEKLLALYRATHDLDYRVIRLANPYGPYQRPNGVLGAVTTFTYKALKDEPIQVYGDGSVVRDFIFIEDAVRAILNVAASESQYRTFNVGGGQGGTSIRQVLDAVQNALRKPLRVEYTPSRPVDVPENYLDISRYQQVCGPLNPLPLEEGIRRTAQFLKEQYAI